jgi:phage-related protein
MSTQVATAPLLSKNQVLDSLRELPEKVSADALIEHILFMQSVVSGIEQASLGKTTSHEQAMLEIRSWKK